MYYYPSHSGNVAIEAPIYRPVSQSFSQQRHTHLAIVVLHVAVSVLIGINQHEAEVVELDGDADAQVLSGVVLGQTRAEALLGRLLDAAALEELAAHDARVPHWRLVHQDGVVRQEVADDEASVLVDGLGGVHASQEAQHVAVQTTSVLQSRQRTILHH